VAVVGVARLAVTSRRRHGHSHVRRLVWPVAAPTSNPWKVRFRSVPPKFISPCIPTTAKTIPHSDAWLHEPKLDGYRLQIVKDGRQVRLYSRNGHEWTKRLASLAEAL
jgi:bifunctional non-homologous end joining protein LigD